jgi:hypothetical protein
VPVTDTTAGARRPLPSGRPKITYVPGYKGKSHPTGATSCDKCALCRHPDCYRAELLLAAGASSRAVAAKLGGGLGHMTVLNHWNRHVSAERKAQMIRGPVKLQGLAERAAEESLTTLDYLRIVRQALIDQFLLCVEAGDRHATAILTGRLMEVIREHGKLTGKINAISGDRIVNNTAIFFASPSFAELQAMLMAELAPYPDARRAVLAGLRRLETQDPGAPPQRVINGKAVEVLDDL